MVTEKGEEESVAKTMTIKVNKIRIFLKVLKEVKVGIFVVDKMST